MPIYQCKICKSPVRDDVERLISLGHSPQRIVDFLHHYKIKISKGSVINHREKHSPRYNEVLGSKILKHRHAADAKKKKEIDMVTTVEMLDKIIDDVDFRLDSGAVVPTVQEAIKAAELKAKIKEGSPFQKSLLALFNAMSTIVAPSREKEPGQITAPAESPSEDAQIEAEILDGPDA